MNLGCYAKQISNNITTPLFPKLRALSITAFIATIFILLSNQQALAYKDAIRSCTPRNFGTAIGQIEDEVSVNSYERFQPTQPESDLEFEMDNPVCIAIAVGSYAATKASIAAMNAACGTGSAVPRVKPSPLHDAFDIGKAGIRAASTGNPQCAAAFGAATSAQAIFIGSMAIIFNSAKKVHEDTQICGHDWKAWNANSMLKDKVEDTQGNKGAVMQFIKDEMNRVKRAFEGNADTNPDFNPNYISKLNLTNKQFRENYYNGAEFFYHGCKDTTMTMGKFLEIYRDELNMTDDELAYFQEVLGDKYPPQAYYMRGLTANYNCQKYKFHQGQIDPMTGKAITAERLREIKGSHDCCIEASKERICIERNIQKINGGVEKKYEFCKAGSRCSIKGVTFSAGYELGDRLLCASTYSLCPYNFNIQSGALDCYPYRDGVCRDNPDNLSSPPGICDDSEYEIISQSVIDSGNCGTKSDIRNPDCSFNSKVGKCQNYCQMLNHCVITGEANYNYQSTLSSPYFSTACINFIGDSKNEREYSTGIVEGPNKHFTAPIAQCFRETIENVFYNRAGHTICGVPGEMPNADGVCLTDSYFYKKGDLLSRYTDNIGNYYQDSFFSGLQNKVQNSIRMVLTIAIMLTGLKILIGGQNLKQKELIAYIIKIAFVMYFATGDAWQGMFFDGVYSASEVISEVVMKVRIDVDEEKRDGCQFGKTYLSDGSRVNIGSPTYPKGLSYLSIWDTLDCKIARYLGYGPSIPGGTDVAKIAGYLLLFLFTGAVGVYFMVALMMFGFFMIIAAARALHIFLVSAVSIILMVYVSPIIIPMILFKKTESIFKNWVNNLIGFSLQPILLFAYIGIFVTIFDTILIGNATFSGNPPQKALVCDDYCVQADRTKTEDMTNCDRGDEGTSAKRPNVDSILCIINFNWAGDVEYWTGPMGAVTFPYLGSTFAENMVTRLITLLKAALLIYILSAFINEIPAIAKGLAGGAKMPDGGKADIGSMLGRANKIGRAIAQRSNGLMMKHAIPRGVNAAKGAAQGAGKAAGAAGAAINRARGKGGNSGGSGNDGGDKGAGGSPKSEVVGDK
ncbi:MAG: type IV secretion system protein [Proteobacteria bacterium]|nr:type IV secretion system protein [Pseudomonadota bacterium]